MAQLRPSTTHTLRIVRSHCLRRRLRRAWRWSSTPSKARGHSWDMCRPDISQSWYSGGCIGALFGQDMASVPESRWIFPYTCVWGARVHSQEVSTVHELPSLLKWLLQYSYPTTETQELAFARIHSVALAHTRREAGWSPAPAVERFTHNFFDSSEKKRGGAYGFWLRALNPDDEWEVQHTEPLYYAASFGLVHVVRSILKSTHGADIDAQGGRIGWTALQSAVYRGRYEVVKLLLHHGANPYAQGSFGETALDIAQHGRDAQIERLLRDAGGPDISRRRWEPSTLRYRMPA